MHPSRLRPPVLRALALAAALAGSGCAAPAPSGPPPTFYPSPPGEPRFQLLATFRGAADVVESGGLRALLAGEDEEARADEIGRAFGLAWAGERLYVCDPGKSRVAVFDFPAREFRFLDPGKRAPLLKPMDIAVAADGEKYVADTGHGRVLVYGPDDEYLRAMGEPGEWKPSAVALSGDSLFVADLKAHRVRVMDRRSGGVQRDIGGEGTEDGMFRFPVAVAVAPGGDLLVTDSFNFRVQRFRPDGTFVSSSGSVGRGPGQFTRPKGCAVDSADRLYVVDAAFQNVQVFDAEGHLLMALGGPGDRAGSLNMPAGIHASREASAFFQDRAAPGYRIATVVFVTSQFGPFKVTAYGFLEPRR